MPSWKATTLAFLMLALSTGTALAKTDAVDAFLARVANTEYLNSHGKPIVRITRDDDGNVIRLRLAKMKLTQAEMKAIRQLKHLEAVSFYQSNITDDDVKLISNHRRLRAINLTSTQVTDRSINHLMTLPSLSSVCLGDVCVTRKAVDRLSESVKNRGRRLALGYSPRRTAKD